MIAPRVENRTARHSPMQAAPPARLNAMVLWLGLSLSDLSALTGHSVSRSTCHRILRGQQIASSRERAALYGAVKRALDTRDSAVLFEDKQ